MLQPTDSPSSKAGSGVEVNPGQRDASEDRIKWPKLRNVNSAGCLRSSVAARC